MLNLVFHAKDDLQRELLAELYKPEVIDDILKGSFHRSATTQLVAHLLPHPHRVGLGRHKAEGVCQDDWSAAEGGADHGHCMCFAPTGLVPCIAKR